MKIEEDMPINNSRTEEESVRGFKSESKIYCFDAITVKIFSHTIRFAIGRLTSKNKSLKVSTENALFP